MATKVADKTIDAVQAEQALIAFVETINNTGGIAIVQDEKKRRGWIRYPVADPEWYDLAEAYYLACTVLGRQPVERDDDQDNDEDY